MSKISPAIEVEKRFNVIVEEYGKFLRQAIVRACPKDLGIQFSDIEQEARLRLWRALQSEREIKDLASYLYKIAATTTLDAVRRVKSKREEQPPWDNDDDDAQVNPDPVAPRPSPEREAQQRELVSKVKAALARLPDNRRRAVALHLEGMTSQEIAGLMGWTEPKARNLIYRGLEDLRETLRAEGIEYEID